MSVTSELPRPLVVHITGAVHDAQFADAIELIQATAARDARNAKSPEVVVVAQARPGESRERDVDIMRRHWPLAGVIALLGSWCEGEIRTGRPWPGVHRLFWHEFPAWWEQQLVLRSAGMCPAWSRPIFDAYRIAPRRVKPAQFNRRGVVVIRAANQENAEGIGDTLRHYGYAIACLPPGKSMTIVRGASAGIWDGGQLDDRETDDLSAFVKSMGRDGAPVIALLDFPRIDRSTVAYQLGVAAVLGKPWINADLVATVQRCEDEYAKASMNRRRAA